MQGKLFGHAKNSVCSKVDRYTHRVFPKAKGMLTTALPDGELSRKHIRYQHLLLYFRPRINGGYRYALSEGDCDAFSAASTLEVMFKTSSNIQDEQAIFSNQQSAGAGLEYSKGNLEYWYRNAKNNSYVHVKAPLEAQRWIHAVTVADGKEVTLYVDGKKCDAAATTGMVIPGPKYYYVGCDTNSDGNPEFLIKSVIALLILAHHATSHQHVAIVACWWLCLAGITHWMKKELSALSRK